jgi:penicillin-binding protein 1A
VGGEERSIHFRSATYGQGARMAMPIWSYYMDKVYADKVLGITKGPFKRPENLSVDLSCSGKVSLDPLGADSVKVQQASDPASGGLDD